MKSFICCVVFAMGLRTLPALAETYDPTWHSPIMTIPRLNTPPAIDGVINNAEWNRATLFPPTVEMDPGGHVGLPIRKRTFIWMAYTTDSIYLAWRQELPPEYLPLQVTITDQRDKAEGKDNMVHVYLDPDTKRETPNFHIAGNAASQLYDRRFDDGSNIHWNPNVTYKSHVIPTGWEGELQIPFKELGVQTAPPDGTQWTGVFFSFWRKGEELLSSWPFGRWREKGGLLVFGGDVPAVRFEDPTSLKVVGGDAQVTTKLFYRPKSRQTYSQQITDALAVSQVEGGTFESFDKIIGDAVAPFKVVEKVDLPGEYLLRYEVKLGDRVLDAGVTPYYKASPLEVEITPLFLEAQQLRVEADSDRSDAKWLEVSISTPDAKPIGTKARGAFTLQQAKVLLPTDKLPEGRYQVIAQSKDAQNKTIATMTVPFEKPAPPDWWTMQYGLTPKIPPPWTPVQATSTQAGMWGRTYDFEKQAVPSQITTRGQKILAAPMEFRGDKAWSTSKLQLVKKDEEAAVYRSESTAGKVKLAVTTQVEFDGFMYVDLDLSGEGETSKLDFVIPFKKEHAVLLQNYCMADGPGDARNAINRPNETNPYKKGSRFVGLIPDDGLQTPPMLTQWIGTDYYGLELSCESSRGWAMARPNQAMEVTREGDRVLLTVHLVSKPIQLSKDKPRHIRFGLIATPAKPLLPYLQKARLGDDYVPRLAPYTWGEYPVWHPPLKNPQLIARNKRWIGKGLEAGEKTLVNGGWNISTQDPMWETWGKEMVAEPLVNATFNDAKQYAACYRTPYAKFMVSSFGYNAKLLGFRGVRFDTVVPSWDCSSLEHRDDRGQTCGWYDDDGKLWPSSQLFAQREVWKRLYRIFHGGVIPEGVVYLPNAAGPNMAVHSFADVHEIGEGFYEKAKSLKEGYPPDMIRANMTTQQYGFLAPANLKGGPLFHNQRIAALIINGAEPRFTDYRAWRSDYSAQGNTAISLWNAWEWVDRWNAQWLPWWLNKDYVQVADGGKMVPASLHLQPGKKVLLTITNYETEPLDDVEVKLNLAKTGLIAPLYAEDAITSEPVAISADGVLRLDILEERYRVIKISNEPPQYRDEVLGPNIVANAPRQDGENWQSQEIALEPNARYVVKALMKIDKNIGADTAKPNIAGTYGPVIIHLAAIQLTGEGVHALNARNKIALTNDKGVNAPEYEPYEDTGFYKRAAIMEAWEKTPGWVTVFIPYGTRGATSGKVVISTTDVGQAIFKNIEVRKVNG